MLPNPAEPRPDSPLRPEEAEVFPWVPEALARLTEAGYGLVIASNQPAAAKGKTTRALLEATHAAILAAAQSAGGVILSSHVCFHRSEDGCACRKPRTGLLTEAFERHAAYVPSESWMVGDRGTDVLTGAAFGLRTALLGGAPQDFALLEAQAIRPTFLGNDLRDFASLLLTSGAMNV
jgi:D-glycero-D-manno-heptose 1,7-bisphosphate phosphatase